MNLLERRGQRPAQHLVDLGPGSPDHVGVLHQEVDREGQQSAGGLVAGDQEGDALVADVLVVQPFPGAGISAFQHPAQQVCVVRRVALLPALVDEGVDEALHIGLVIVELPLGPHLQPSPDRHLAGSRLGLQQRPHHRGDERVRCFAVERVEPVAEPTQGDGVQREIRHVGRHVDDVVGIETIPLAEQLVGDVLHLRHVLLHRLHAERRHQDRVGALPEWILGLGGEQSVAGHALRHLNQPARDELVEAGIVANLVDQFVAGHDDPGGVRCAQLEDGPVFLGQLDHTGDGVVLVEVEEITQHGHTARARKILDVDHGLGRGHDTPSFLRVRDRPRSRPRCLRANDHWT